MGSGVFSAIVDNTPYAATMIPMVQDIPLPSGQRRRRLCGGLCLWGPVWEEMQPLWEPLPM
ncbi:MAG: hypothetical protein LBD55_03230 [Treponema sp.]|nr:hypothetical protein [Treponema sp.]